MCNTFASLEKIDNAERHELDEAGEEFVFPSTQARHFAT